MSKAEVRASIDIGSNSILLLIADFSKKNVEILESESRITSLGFKLDETHLFHEDSMKSSFRALEEFKGICLSYSIKTTDILITATEASRVALNARDFYSKVEKELNVKVNIITSEAEAYFSAKGVLFDGSFKEQIIHVLDVGGASSEIIEIDTFKSELMSSYSLPIGGVRATDWIDQSCFEEKVKSIHEQFQGQIDRSSVIKLFCVGGTITSLACIVSGLESFSEVKINNTIMSSSRLNTLLIELQKLESNELLEKYKFLGKRSKSIFGGLQTIIKLLEWLKISELEVLTYGLRYGTLLEGEIKNEYIA